MLSTGWTKRPNFQQRSALLCIPASVGSGHWFGRVLSGPEAVLVLGSRVDRAELGEFPQPLVPLTFHFGVSLHGLQSACWALLFCSPKSPERVETDPQGVGGITAFLRLPSLAGAKQDWNRASWRHTQCSGTNSNGSPLWRAYYVRSVVLKADCINLTWTLAGKCLGWLRFPQRGPCGKNSRAGCLFRRESWRASWGKLERETGKGVRLTYCSPRSLELIPAEEALESAQDTVTTGQEGLALDTPIWAVVFRGLLSC